MLLDYVSTRGLLDVLVGLIEGVGKHYNQPVAVKKAGGNRLEVTFD